MPDLKFRKIYLYIFHRLLKFSCDPHKRLTSHLFYCKMASVDTGYLLISTYHLLKLLPIGIFFPPICFLLFECVSLNGYLRGGGARGRQKDGQCPVLRIQTILLRIRSGFSLCYRSGSDVSLRYGSGSRYLKRILLFQRGNALKTVRYFLHIFTGFYFSVGPPGAKQQEYGPGKSYGSERIRSPQQCQCHTSAFQW